MGYTVIGIFEDSSNAYEAAEKLKRSGFSNNDVDIADNKTDDRTTMGSYREDEEEDGITRFFNNLFGNNDESEYYSEVSRRSSSIVTVHAKSNEEANRAASILDDHGAVDVDERAAQYGYRSGYDSDTDRDTGIRDRSITDDDDSKSIPIIEEELHIGKREVETGGVRVRSRIVEKPVEETLRLRHERVTVERNPVNRKATDQDMENFREGDIDVTERAEVPVVNKEARVVEEVKVNKHTEERQETVRENVRKTEVDIDKHSDNDVKNRNRTDDDLTEM